MELTNVQSTTCKPFVKNPRGDQNRTRHLQSPIYYKPHVGVAKGKHSSEPERKAAGNGVPLQISLRDSDEDESSDSEQSADEYAYLATHGPPEGFPKADCQLLRGTTIYHVLLNFMALSLMLMSHSVSLSQDDLVNSGSETDEPVTLKQDLIDSLRRESFPNPDGNAQPLAG
jgi:hypothetical protein